ncbi:MAG: Rrf2 family transcriptional regulator [Bacteroidetes bacterium]|nr:Rrf2 family transcriptional regulator [Bacteroidota bacterium]
MLKLSKKTEYAFMAARHLAMNNSGHYSTAKEIADNCQIPYQLVAKVLQNFARNKIATSFQGAKGGYKLNKSPDNISLIDIIKAVEHNYQVTECMQQDNSRSTCSHLDCCKIRDPLIEIQRKIENVFEQTSLKQIL